MFKRLLCIATALMLLVLCSLSASAASDDLILITNPNGAILYDSYDLQNTRPIALIPRGSAALHIASLDWGYCVVFGNYAGYIFEDEGIPVSSGYFEFALPSGENYSYSEEDSWQNDEWSRTYVPEFPYAPIGCEPLEDQISTRSGPNTNYTWEGNHSPRLLYRALYRTEGNGIDWVCVEFSKYDVKYRLYTGMWRLEAVQSVPYDEEEYVWARITQEHTPNYGPGYDYAPCYVWSVPCTVKAFFLEYG